MPEISDMITGTVSLEEWLLKEPFVISRSRRTHAQTVHLRISDGYFFGQGECQPNSRYGETQEKVQRLLESCFPASILELETFARTLPSMAARNALDCALWDMRCKKLRKPVWDILGLEKPAAVATVFTLSVGTPEEMAVAAERAVAQGKSRLKLKMAGNGDLERIQAIRSAVPNASIMVDANESWTENQLVKYLPSLAEFGVEMFEQPLKAGADSALLNIEKVIPICADESCLGIEDLAGLKGKYDVINIKLDKTGGLTPALELQKEAINQGFKVMVGCMLGTSLAIAPALLVASTADYVDLDAPLLLAQDRQPECKVAAGLRLEMSQPALWG